MCAADTPLARRHASRLSRRPAIFSADTDQGSKKTAMKYSWTKNISEQHMAIDLLKTKPFRDDGFNGEIFLLIFMA